MADFGNNVLVSVPNEEIVERDAGAVYLFEGATGKLIRTFKNPTPGISDVFGSSITTIGNNIAFTAVLDSTAAVNGGAVYLFDGSRNLITRLNYYMEQLANISSDGVAWLFQSKKAQ